MYRSTWKHWAAFSEPQGTAIKRHFSNCVIMGGKASLAGTETLLQRSDHRWKSKLNNFDSGAVVAHDTKAPDNEGKINQLLESLEEMNSGALTIMHKISRDLDQEKKKLSQTLQDKEEETLSLEEVMKKTVQENEQVLEEIQHLKAENVKLKQRLKTLLADLNQSDYSDPLTDNEAPVPVNPTEDSNSLAAAECTKDLIEMIQFVASNDDDSQDSVNAVASFMRKYPAMSSEALRRAGFAAW